MELWIIYAIIGMIFSGFFVFSQKIAAERKYSSIEFCFASLVGQVIGSFIGWLFVEDLATTDWQSIVVFAGAVGILTIVGNSVRVQGLKYIDSAIYFPIYKAIGPIIVTLIGVYIFKEDLTPYEILGIIIGITVPLLLVHSSEKQRQNDLKKGLLLMLTVVLIGAIAATIQKIVVDNDAGNFLFIFISSIIGSIFAYLYILKTPKTKEKLPYKQKDLYTFGTSIGLLNTLAIYFIMKSYAGSLAIAYTIVSFYILIPIILSIIIYKEHTNFRKTFAIILSLCAIVLFQL